MRRAALLLVLVVAAAGAAAAWFLTRAESGPFPTPGHVRVHGLAAWPADTVEEARAECDGAPEWRRDALQTALRFASEVMGYPAPHTTDWAHPGRPHQARFLVNTDGIERLFLGSLLELKRYGHCWYVVNGEPREGGEPSVTLAFVYRGGRPHLLLGTAGDVPPAHVGYGSWDVEVEREPRQTVLEMPELDANGTGHAIYLDPDEDGVSEGVGIDALGAVPPAPQGGPTGRLSAPPPIRRCRTTSYAAQTPKKIIRQLFDNPFENLLQRAKGQLQYERKRVRHLGGDRWRIVADRAVLDATIARGNRCARLVAIEPVDGDTPLRRAWIERDGATAIVDWGGGDDAYVELGTARTGAGGMLKQIREPVTFRWTDGPPDAPVYALVVLYDEGHIVSASYGLYSAGSS